MKKEITEEKRAQLAMAREAMTKLRRRRYRRRFDPEVRSWNLWNHDLDTLLHEIVKNPALAEIEPEVLIARAERFVDALWALQDRRRPATLTKEDDE